MPNRKITLDDISAPADTRALTGEAITKINKGSASERQAGATSPEEATKYANEYKTMGRGGCRMPRLNLSITPDNLDYVKIMSKCNGETYGRFIGHCIEEHRENHPEMYKRYKEITETNEALKEAEEALKK